MKARGEPDRIEIPTEGPDIEAVCRAFEDAWRTTDVRHVEEFLQRVPGFQSAIALRQLLAREMDLRKAAGESIDLGEFRARYPQQLQDVEVAHQLHCQHQELRGDGADADDDRELVQVLDRYLADVQSGRSPDKAILLAAHPEIASQLDACLAGIDLIHGSSGNNQLPQSIGRYTVQDTLGEGAFGRVYLARDPELNRLVALKIPHVGPFASQEELDQFLEEARTAAQLDHEGIVTIYDVFREGEQVVIVQQYVEGQDLRSCLVTSEPQRPTRCAQILLGISEAVSAAHERGFVHRDLKPSNILLDQQGKPCVADFGLAIHKSVKGLRRGEKSGTPQYMSPEQVRGDVHVLDGRSDIWSLGVVLYEMLVGERPFQGQTSAELFDNIENADPIAPRSVRQDIPEELENICLKCLGKNVDQRYRSAAVLPFADVSSEENRDYFCEGMTEELISRLSRIRELRVVSRTSVQVFKNSTLDAQGIGHQLNVDAILEGSVRRLEGRLRITAELINVSDGFVFWSERFDRDLEDVFAIQDEIACNIVQSLELTLSGSEKQILQSPPTSSVQAYDYYLRGRKFFDQYHRRGMELALKMFALAIKHDPLFGMAYAGIADCHGFLFLYSDQDPAILERADQASKKALELNPSSPEAHVSRAGVLYLCGRHLEAESESEQAIQLGPHLFDAYYHYARHSFARGQEEKAVRLFMRAAEQNPRDYQCPLLVAQCYEHLGQPEKAREARRRGVEIVQERLAAVPDDVRALYMGANALAALGEWEKSLEWASFALSMEPDEPMVLYNMGCIYALVGDVEGAIGHLEHAVRAGLRQKDWLDNDGNLDPLREHPRFQSLRRELDSLSTE
jgi:serine/threonine protein kinase/Flp pilus assembly protein TadD